MQLAAIIISSLAIIILIVGAVVNLEVLSGWGILGAIITVIAAITGFIASASSFGLVAAIIALVVVVLTFALSGGHDYQRSSGFDISDIFDPFD